MTALSAPPTVNDIKQSVCEAGSHWFSPDAMRSFGTRVHSTVYAGPGGIYFVTSDKDYKGTRAHTVRQFIPPDAIATVGDVGNLSRSTAHTTAKNLAKRSLASQIGHATAYASTEHILSGAPFTFLGQLSVSAKPYDDGSGFYLNLVAGDREAFSNTYGQQQEVCRILKTHASGGYVADLVEAVERFDPVTDEAQFLADLHAHGCESATTDDVRRLKALATAHHRWMEDACNGVDIYDEDSELIKPVAHCVEKIESIAKRIGCKGVHFQGDPRGCTVKLQFHDGCTNDWGRDGWCVPTAR